MTYSWRVLPIYDDDVDDDDIFNDGLQLIGLILLLLFSLVVQWLLFNRFGAMVAIPIKPAEAG